MYDVTADAHNILIIRSDIVCVSSDVIHNIAPSDQSEKVIWNEELDKAFNAVKKAIASPQGIQVPRRSDRLQTSSDFSKTANAIGGMLTSN